MQHKELVRSGFWQADQKKPSLPEDLQERKKELEKKLHQLIIDSGLKPSDSTQSLLKKTKNHQHLSRKKEKKESRALWLQRLQRDIPYLGEDVSFGLSHQVSDSTRLTALSLPEFESPIALAEAMGVTLEELRFLAFNRKVSKTTHYQQFLVEKKSGGVRKISSPMPRLKKVQHWILKEILEKIPLHDAAHGFIKQRSIATNAQTHINKSIVINVDLQDFFPSIHYRRVKGVFVHLGYSEQLATILALLITEADTDQVEYDDTVFYVQTGERYLPQGAPTSPAMSNRLCLQMDKRLLGMANSLGFDYSRYADDLTFSTHSVDDSTVKKLLWRLEQIIIDEGFQIHPDKTRIMRKHQQQEVTGVVVNRQLSLDRKKLKRFRALLFQVETDGVEGKVWDNGKGTNLIASLKGYANYVYMIDKEKGTRFLNQLQRIENKYGHLSPKQPDNFSVEKTVSSVESASAEKENHGLDGCTGIHEKSLPVLSSNIAAKDSVSEKCVMGAKNEESEGFNHGDKEDFKLVADKRETSPQPQLSSEFLMNSRNMVAIFSVILLIILGVAGWLIF